MKSGVNKLLVSGVAASLVYIAVDVITGLITNGYSFRDQTVSELSAIGAPTRWIWMVTTFVHNPLLMVFGWGVLKTAKNNRPLKISGRLLILWGVLGFFWLFFPMNLRGSIGGVRDTMHLIMTGLTVVLLIALIVGGSGSLGKKFRIYSWMTILLMTVFGIMTGQQASKVAEQLPTPWMGITERITSYLPLVWVMVLSFYLWRYELKADKNKENKFCL